MKGKRFYLRIKFAFQNVDEIFMELAYDDKSKNVKVEGNSFCLRENEMFPLQVRPQNWRIRYLQNTNRIQRT